MNKKFNIYNYKKYLYSLSFTILTFLLILNVFSGIKKEKNEVIYANEILGFDNKFDFSGVNNDDYISTNEYVYYDEVITLSDEDLITNDTLAYPFLVSNLNHKIIVISNVEELVDFSNRCNGKYRRYYLSFHYVLGNNITFNANQFVAIGTLAYPFAGIFDGQGFEIKNLILEEIKSSENDNGKYQERLTFKENEDDTLEQKYEYHSIFSYNNGIIKNLGIVNATIIQAEEFSNLGNDKNLESYTSFLVGNNMKNGNVSYCYVIDNATEKENDNTIPGIVAYGFQIAGLVCNNDGSFHDNYIKIDQLYEERQVEGSTVEAPIYVQPVIIRNNNISLNNYYDGTIYTSLPSYIVDETLNIAIGKIGEENVFENDNYFIKDENWHTSNDYGSYGIEFEYPKLQGLTRYKDENNEYTNDLLIKKPIDLIIMKDLINNYNSLFKNVTFVINNDIDMSSLSKDIFTPISEQFQGTFKSILKDSSKYATSSINNKYPCAIVNLTINANTTLTNNIGMFLNLTNATIKDLYFVNASVRNNTSNNISTDSKISVGILASYTHNNNKLTTIDNVHINSNVKISSSNEVKFGSFFGEVNYGSVSISNCSTSGLFDGSSSKNNTYTSYIGGFVGYTSNISITNSFNNLTIKTLSSNQISNTATVYTGGIIGQGIINSLYKVGNKADIYTYDNTSTNTTYTLKSITGGIIGNHIGYINNTLNNTYGKVSLVTNEGNIHTQAYYYGNNASNILVMASGFGIVDFIDKTISQENSVFNGITNLGSLDINNYNVNNQTSLTRMSQDQLLGSRGYFLTPGMIVLNTSCNIDGLYNLKYQTVDISLVPSYAPNLYTNNYPTTINNKTIDFVINLTRSYNKGNINFVTNSDDYGFNHKLTGNALGKYINYNEIRNEGNLFLNVTKNMNVTMNNRSYGASTTNGINQNEYSYYTYNNTSYQLNLQKTIRLDGLFDVVSPGRVAKNLYNGGTIAVNYTTTNITVYSMLYISGICYKNENIDVYKGTEFENNLQKISDSIVFPSSMEGSIHNAINNGEIVVNSPRQWYGCIRVGGIATVNDSLITSSFNLANISIYNNIPSIGNSGFSGSGQFENEAGGITYQMHTGYAALMDCANYGDIIIYSDSIEGYALAGGIAARNDKTESGVDFKNTSIPEAQSLGTAGFVGRLIFCINYGDIYTWTNKSEDYNGATFWDGTLTGEYGNNNRYNGSMHTNGEYATKAGGMVGNGLMTTIDCLNFGNIYSRYNAGGIYANVRLDVFNILSSQYKMLIANSVNYGNIKKINAAKTVSSPLISSLNNGTLTFTNLMNKDCFTDNLALEGKISSTTYNINERWQFGGIIGNLNSMDEGNSNGVLSQAYLNTLIVSCVYNFNDYIDVIGLVTYSTDSSLTTAAQNFIKYMGTTNQNDTTPYPFNNDRYGTSYKIPSFTHDEDETTGVFSNNFPLKNPKLISSADIASNAYIEDYFRFIPYANVGDVLKQKLQITDTQGIYGLSSSATILDGIFMPENVDLDSLSPLKLDDEGNIIRDTSWYGNVLDTTTVYGKLYNAMKQQKDSMASTIYDLTLKDDNNHILADPLIDQDNKTITYYIAKNADEFNGSSITYTNVLANATISNDKQTISYYASSFDNVHYENDKLLLFKANFNGNEYVIDASSISQYINANAITPLNSDVIQNNINITYNTFIFKSNNNSYSLAASATSSNLIASRSSATSSSNNQFALLTDEDINNIKTTTTSISVGASSIDSTKEYYLYNVSNKKYVGSSYFNSTNNSITLTTDPTIKYRIVSHSSGTTSGYSLYSVNNTSTTTNNLECISYSTTGTTARIVNNYYSSASTIWTVTQNSYVDTKSVNVSYYKNYNVEIATHSSNNYYVNLNKNTYSLAPNASLLKNNENETTKLASIKLPYLSEQYTSSTIYCYSQAYLHGLTGSEYYSSYEIRIYLIDNKEFFEFYDVEIDNVEASTTTNTDKTITTISNEMASLIDETTGYIKFSMDVKNIANNQNLTRNLVIRNSKGEDVTSYFILDSSLANNGIVISTSLNDDYSTGTVTFKYKALENTLGDTYSIEIKLNDSLTKILKFTKTKSNRNYVENFIFNEEKFVNSSTNPTNEVESSILYGSYYNEKINSSCKYLDFSSLNDEIPSYLTSFAISRFAKLIDVNMTYSKVNGLYNYKVTYTIEAEDQTINTFTHLIKEKEPENNIQTIYKGLDDSNTLPSPITITRDEIPTFRVYYQFTNFFFSSDDEYLKTSLSYMATNNSDAFIISKLVNLNSNTYQITFENGQTYNYVVNDNNKVGNTIYISNDTYYIGTTSTNKKASETTITSISKRNSENIYEVAFSDNSVITYSKSNSDNNDLGLYVIDNNWYCGNNSMNVGMSFIDYDIKFYNNEYMAIYLPAIAPTGTYTVNVLYVHDDYNTTPTYSWNYSFEQFSIIKTKSADSHLKNVFFTSENAITGQNTIIDVNEFTVEEFENAYHNSNTRKILVSQRGINYKEYATNQIYYVVGEVASTDLTLYAPSFSLPTGAYIKRVIVDSNNNITYSDDFRSDFNPLDSQSSNFNYVFYRVFAEDYTTTNLHYTDYHIAVIDRTYTVKFDIKVILSDNINENLANHNIYATLTRYYYNKDDQTYDLNNALDYSSMFIFINDTSKEYDKNNNIGFVKENTNTIYSCDFPANISGYYKIYLDLPDGYTFTYKVSNISDTSYSKEKEFAAIANLVPKRFNIEITIIKDENHNSWGEIYKDNNI